MSAEEDWYMGSLQAEYEDAEDDPFLQNLKELAESLWGDKKNRQVNALSPMQLMTQMNETLSKASDFFGKVVNIKGIYQQGNGLSYNGYCYDKLKDENNVTQVDILVPVTIRAKMKPNSLVIVCGMITKRVEGMKSTVRLLFRVDSIVEEVKADAIDKDDQRRIELRKRKVEAGFKNVDSMLESMLLKGERPRVALVLPTTNSVFEDFEHGKRAASLAIDFVDRTVTFTHTSDLCNILRTLDGLGFNAIALVRGGGIDSKTDVDKPEVIETVVGMRTPFISGLGHAPEIIFLRQVADKWTPNPNALGQYFAEIVEKAAEKRTNSRAALVKEVEGQFKKQIDDAQKQNKDLQEKLTNLTKTHEDAQKEQTKQLTNLQDQLKKQAETLKTQTDNLTKLQTTNNDLNKSIQQLTVKHSLAEKEREIEKEKVKQLEDKLKDKTRNMIWVYIIIAALSLIAGFVIARLTIAPS